MEILVESNNSIFEGEILQDFSTHLTTQNVFITIHRDVFYGKSRRTVTLVKFNQTE